MPVRASWTVPNLDAEAWVSGGWVVEGTEQGFGEEGAAVVDIGVGGQASHVRVAVGVGQVSEACVVIRDMDAAAAERVHGSGAVATVRPCRRS